MQTLEMISRSMILTFNYYFSSIAKQRQQSKSYSQCLNVENDSLIGVTCCFSNVQKLHEVKDIEKQLTTKSLDGPLKAYVIAKPSEYKLNHH